MSTFMPYSHQHFFMELHLPLQGEEVYRVQDESVCLKPLDALFIGKNVAHSISSWSEDLEKFSIGFLPVQSSCATLAWLESVQKNEHFFKVTLPDWYKPLLLNTIRESERKNDYVLYSTLIALLTQLADLRGEYVSAAPNTRQQNEERIQQIEMFVEIS